MDYTERERIAGEILAWVHGGDKATKTAWEALCDILSVDFDEQNLAFEKLAALLIYDPLGDCKWIEETDGEQTWWTADCCGYTWDDEACYKPSFCPWCGDAINWLDLDDQRAIYKAQHEDAILDLRAGK